MHTLLAAQLGPSPDTAAAAAALRARALTRRMRPAPAPAEHLAPGRTCRAPKDCLCILTLANGVNSVLTAYHVPETVLLVFVDTQGRNKCFHAFMQHMS